jgi:xylose isomerase
LAEFDVSVLTIRCGTHTVRAVAENAAAARRQIQSECDKGHNHCPAEWCTDDVQTTIVQVKQVALDDVTIIAADGVGLGTFYTDDTLRRARIVRRDPGDSR